MFEPEKLYSPRDPELTTVFPYSTTASWRHEGRGPAYIKIGPRVFYKGSDLNEFLKAHRVEPAAAAASA